MFNYQIKQNALRFKNSKRCEIIWLVARLHHILTLQSYLLLPNTNLSDVVFDSKCKSLKVEGVDQKGVISLKTKTYI